MKDETLLPDEELIKRLKTIWWGSGDSHCMSNDTASKIIASCRAALQSGYSGKLNRANSFTDDELMGMAHGDNPVANAYRELLEFRRNAAVGVSGQPVTVPDEKLPLDYLQGQKDGLEWAAQMAEVNHPETGDWLYDDPLELAKAIRKGPDMSPAQPVPVVSADLLHAAASAIEDLLTTKDRTGAGVWFDLPFKLRSAANAQPAPVAPKVKP